MINEPANAPQAQAADLTIPHDAQVTAVPKNSYPVHWRRTVITLPDHNDASNARQIGEELLPVINRGATTLIAVVTATVSTTTRTRMPWCVPTSVPSSPARSCGWWVTAQVVQRTLTLNGLDRLIPVWPSLKQPPRRSANNVGPCDA